MIGWLIYDQKQYDINKWFADELIKYCTDFSEIRLIIIEKLKFGIYNDESLYYYDNQPIGRPDYAIVRTIFPLLSGFLEHNGVRVINKFAISEICNDKRLTYLTVAKSGVPILPTLFFDKRFLNEQQVDSIHFPCIVKSASGHGGQEVSLIENGKDLLSFVNSISSNDYLIQKICPTTGRDLRVYILGEKIIGAVLRSSENYKSNYSLGGNATYYDLSCDEIKLVYQVIKCLPHKPDFIGIDFLLDKNNFVFNEIEDVVGSKMLYATTNIDVARMFANHISSIV